MSKNELAREIVSTIVWLVGVFAVAFLIRAFLFEPFVVSGSSMEDTLHDGERMVMLKQNEIERFDVVVHPAPNNSDELYIKRVIGMPGDTVQIEDDYLILNGQKMDEPYLYNLKAAFDANNNNPFTYDYDMELSTGEATVPENHVLVMGDNRRNSLDGRKYGFVSMDDIRGEADWVHWPLGQMRVVTKYELSPDGSEIVVKE